MYLNRFSWLMVAVLLSVTLLGACGGTVQAPTDTEDEEEAAATDDMDAVTLQLKWVPQAQFAGFFAASELGYYEDEGLDLTIRPGGPDIAPEQVVAGRQAEFGINWLSALLAVRDQGTPLINIAQHFQFSGMREISWAEDDIEDPADLEDKRVGVWFNGSEYALLATLNKYGLDPDTDVELVSQPFDMNLFLNREVDAAAVTTYNELYQVLSAGHSLDDLNIIDFNEEDTAMLEDGIFVREDWLEEDENKDIAARFLRASFRGWEHCRDQPEECVDFVLANDESGVMTEDAQSWQMAEVNKLVWGDPIDMDLQIGYMSSEQFEQTADIAYEFEVIDDPATDAAYTHEIWEMATEGMDDDMDEETDEEEE